MICELAARLKKLKMPKVQYKMLRWGLQTEPMKQACALEVRNRYESLVIKGTCGRVASRARRLGWK